MFDFSFEPSLSKVEFYKELLKTTEALISGQRDLDKPVNWAGFYLTAKDKADLLRLGPFQGKVACTEMKFGRGVCGAAAKAAQTQVVPNVHEFPGHIACDSASASEIVVPLVSTTTGNVLGVLDIDNMGIEAFDDDDKVGLEAVVQLLVKSCDWNE